MTMPVHGPKQILEELVLELRAKPGRLGILAEVSGSVAPVTWLSTALNWDTLSVGRVLARGDRLPTPDEIEAALQGSHVFVDCQVLFDPSVGIEPIQLFRRLARRTPSFSCWPGEIRDRTFSYSRLGRPDQFEDTVQDAIVLRPRASAFPDEFPYTIERI
jgi:hypothetical protein